MKAPCKNCKERHDLCHSDCPLYLEFKRDLEDQRKKREFEKITRPVYKTNWYNRKWGNN